MLRNRGHVTQQCSRPKTKFAVTSTLMSKPKRLLSLPEQDLSQASENGQPETGHGFLICASSMGILAVMSDGAALPLDANDKYYDLSDLLAGEPIPVSRKVEQVSKLASLSSRAAALSTLHSLKTTVTAGYAGVVGAVPLVFSQKLPAKTVFCRYLAANTDFRYSAGELAANTYLSPVVEAPHMPTGFSVVGRLSLPIPLPPRHIFFYELGKGVTIRVGTVSPAFGQAGGGVEILLDKKVAAIQSGPNLLPPW